MTPPAATSPSSSAAPASATKARRTNINPSAARRNDVSHMGAIKSHPTRKGWRRTTAPRTTAMPKAMGTAVLGETSVPVTVARTTPAESVATASSVRIVQLCRARGRSIPHRPTAAAGDGRTHALAGPIPPTVAPTARSPRKPLQVAGPRLSKTFRGGGVPTLGASQPPYGHLGLRLTGCGPA